MSGDGREGPRSREFLDENWLDREISRQKRRKEKIAFIREFKYGEKKACKKGEEGGQKDEMLLRNRAGTNGLRLMAKTMKEECHATTLTLRIDQILCLRLYLALA